MICRQKSFPFTALVNQKLFRDLSVFNYVAYNVCGSGIEIVWISGYAPQAKLRRRADHPTYRRYYITNIQSKKQ